MIVKNDKGKRFYVRVVFKGDKYGHRDCLVHDFIDPMIEFYDFDQNKVSFGLRGQFVSRYNASTLAEHPEWQGLCLMGHEPTWSVDAETLAPVLYTARELVRE